MKSFEEYMAREDYNTARDERAARKRRADRQLTREEAREKRRRYSVIVSTASFLALAALVGLAVALSPAEDAEPSAAEPAALEEPVAEEHAELTQGDYENALIEQALLERATMIPDCKITHYCICEKCCGKAPGDPGYGITASGRRATPYVSVGVDPDVIPLGADVLVDYGDGEIHYYRADDTGSGVSGTHIDLCVESHQEAINLGVRTATVYWIVQGT